ncbi:MAG: phage tail-like protein [Phenylobacterium sp.]|jgi:phage tail-like protein
MSLDSYFDLPVAFQFTVVPLLNPLDQGSFQEVGGIEATIEVDKVVEGGQNRYVHQLPTSISHSNLTLKRGVASITSALVVWCLSVFEGGFDIPIVPMDLAVSLLDENGMPLRVWSVFSAWPVKWQVDAFNSTKNEVAIETIELSYNHFIRVM